MKQSGTHGSEQDVGTAQPVHPEGKGPCGRGPGSYLLLSGAEAGGPDRGVGHPGPASPVLWERPQGQAGAQRLEAGHVWRTRGGGPLCGGRGGTGQSRSGWAGSSGPRPTPSSPSLAPGPPGGAVRRSEVGGRRVTAPGGRPAVLTWGRCPGTGGLRARDAWVRVPLSF